MPAWHGSRRSWSWFSSVCSTRPRPLRCRTREREWQFPAAKLPVRDVVRGVAAMGFTALTLDRYGYINNGRHDPLQDLEQLLGEPIAQARGRLYAWDLRPVARSLLGGMSVTA